MQLTDDPSQYTLYGLCGHWIDEAIVSAMHWFDGIFEKYVM